ncbi:MAG TPA: GNAT family protein [Ktedonobacteraceae bacterium]|nr:GNAT family protein [Ktedonobacteraceae bacterium]
MTFDAAFTRFPTLTTKRLRLRQIELNDAKDLFATFSDKEVMRFYGQEPHRSLNETRQWIEYAQTNYRLRETMRWGITLKDEDKVIGSCSFHYFDREHRRAETGYELNRAFWRQGLMTEAMAAALTYGFTKLDLHRVEAIINIANEPSKGLLLKLGFIYEGNLRQRRVFRGRFEDEHYFGLLQDEWLGLV